MIKSDAMRFICHLRVWVWVTSVPIGWSVTFYDWLLQEQRKKERMEEEKRMTEKRNEEEARRKADEVGNISLIFPNLLTIFPQSPLSCPTILSLLFTIRFIFSLKNC